MELEDVTLSEIAKDAPQKPLKRVVPIPKQDIPQDRTMTTPGPPPTDVGNLHFLAFTLLGAGFLFPYNSFISAIDYFLVIYGHKSGFTIPLAYVVTTAFTVFNNSMWIMDRFSTNSRILFGYVMFICSLTLVPLTDVLLEKQLLSPDNAFLLTVGAIFITGLGSGVQQSSLYGYASMMPTKYTGAIMLGESVAGLIVSLNRIITKAAITCQRDNARTFFYISIGVELLALFLHIITYNGTLVRYYLTKCARLETSYDGKEKKRTVRTNILGSIHIRLRVIKRIFPLEVGIANVYLVTLLVFPGSISMIKSEQLGDWLPIILIAVFNLMDFIGTGLSILPYPLTEKQLLIGGTLRWLFVPLILLCAMPRHESGAVLSHPAIPIILMILFGVSNGYLGSAPMSLAPTFVADEYKEIAGNLMTFFLLFGLSIGASLAFGMQRIVCLEEYGGCNTTTVLNITDALNC